jgi:hypothetical protein
VEIQVEYSNLEDRRIKVQEQEAHGLRMLHDDFHSTWKPGDEPHGTMVFTDIIESSPPPIDWQTEWDKATTVADKATVLARMLRLKVR